MGLLPHFLFFYYVTWCVRLSAVHVAAKVFNQYTLCSEAVDDAKATNALVVDPALVTDCDSLFFHLLLCVHLNLLLCFHVLNYTSKKYNIFLGFTLIYKNIFTAS